MEIKEKVDEYGRLDSQMKDLKKTMDVEKDEIKNYMIENAMDSYSADDYKVQCVKSTKTAMNEAGTLSVLKEYWEKEHGSEECPFVKTIEVLNHDELEKSIIAKIADEVKVGIRSGRAEVIIEKLFAVG